MGVWRGRRSGSHSSFMMIPTSRDPGEPTESCFAGGCEGGGLFRKGLYSGASTQTRKGVPARWFMERGSRSEKSGSSGGPGRPLWQEGHAAHGVEDGPARGLCTEGGAQTPAKAGPVGGPAGGAGRAEGGAGLGSRGAAGKGAVAAGVGAGSQAASSSRQRAAGGAWNLIDQGPALATWPPGHLGPCPAPPALGQGMLTGVGHGG